MFEGLMGFIVLILSVGIVILSTYVIYVTVKQYSYRLMFDEYLTYYKIGRIIQMAEGKGFSIKEIMKFHSKKEIIIQDSNFEVNEKLEEEISKELNKSK